ncbi:hypothetical protein BB561_005679 [Smittium simulii]|uniref:Uncharacterized protein n=1 Tax=Smittium simulii TaxID=133385 RepID=A0A2T9Y906_9FUNG|nr:hypothetical protein BB561_005679 [Smittium simulii]
MSKLLRFNGLWHIQFKRNYSLRPFTFKNASFPANTQLKFSNKATPRGHKMNNTFMIIHKRSFIKYFNDPFAAESFNKLKPLMNIIVIGCVLSISGILAYLHGSHWYIENFIQPTSPQLDEETRRLLRAYAFRKKMYPNPRIAIIYTERAIENLKKLDLLDLSNPLVLDVYIKYADAQLSINDNKNAQITLKTIISSLDSLLMSDRTTEMPDKTLNSAESKIVNSNNMLLKECILYNLANSKFNLGKISTENGDFNAAKNEFAETLSKIFEIETLVDSNAKIYSDSQKIAKISAFNLLKTNATICLGEIFTIENKYKNAEILLSGALDLVTAHNLSQISDQVTNFTESDLLNKTIDNDPFTINTVYQPRSELSSSNQNYTYKLNALAVKVISYIKNDYELYIKQAFEPKSKKIDKIQVLDGWVCLDAIIMNQMAQLYKKKHDYTKFTEFCNKVISLTSTKHNISSCAECAHYSLTMLADFYKEQQNMTLASEYYNKSAELVSKQNLFQD